MSPLHLKSTGSQSRLTSAATVQGFNTQMFREILTLTLSLGERELTARTLGFSAGHSANPAASFLTRRRIILPLPAGEGRGEGDHSLRDVALTQENAGTASKETPRDELPPRSACCLEPGACGFSGAWSLGFGTFLDSHFVFQMHKIIPGFQLVGGMPGCVPHWLGCGPISKTSSPPF